MISSWVDFPVHQTSLPVRYVATSDRNFYDRYYFNLHASSDELFSPASWCEPGLPENLWLAETNAGWRLVDDGATSMDGALPVNPSGGLLGANPIGAAGLVRFAEAAMQVRGTAGEHQIDGARLAVGHAQGGFSNFVAMWVVGRDRP